MENCPIDRIALLRFYQSTVQEAIRADERHSDLWSSMVQAKKEAEELRSRKESVADLLYKIWPTWQEASEGRLLWPTSVNDLKVAHLSERAAAGLSAASVDLDLEPRGRVVSSVPDAAEPRGTVSSEGPDVKSR